MMPKILVTGGAGYIGSHTIIELISKGFEVVSVDNYLNSNEDSYKRIEEITGVKIPFFNVDLAKDTLTNAFFDQLSQIDGVIHFAALKSVPDSVANPLFYYSNNNNALINILSNCDRLNIENVIFSSSCSVYGNVPKEYLPVTESTPTNQAESPYANTKKMGEEIIKHFSKNSSVKTIALRYFNPVGAHMSGKIGEMPAKRVNNLIPVITRSAAGITGPLTIFGDDWDTRDGSCIRDYIHVSDIADAHVNAIGFLLSNSMTSNFDIINLGSGNGVSVIEAIKSFEKNTGIKVPFSIGERRDGDVESIYSNPKKAQDLLKWTAKRNIDEMMTSAWKWQQEIIEKEIETI